MSDLLVPADERELVAFLCRTLGARLLLSDIAPRGQPRLADDAVLALPAELPGRARLGNTEVSSLTFWLPDCGPIRTMRDAPEPRTAHDRVARVLARDAASDRFADVIDLERTPVLTLRRSTRMLSNRLAPGGLGSMPIGSSLIPDEVSRRHAAASRWLKRCAVKIDPFSHCPEVQTRRPQRLGLLWVWVQPHAFELVQRGLEIWPWTA